MKLLWQTPSLKTKGTPRYVHSTKYCGKLLHFAIDNTDFRNDTPDGKSEFHGTGTVALQKFEADAVGKAIEIERSSKSSMNTRLMRAFQHLPGIIECEELQLYSKTDKTQALCQVLTGDIDLPTWSAYNFLITEELVLTTCQGLPLIPTSPTWLTLYSALKIVQGINVEVTGHKKTINYHISQVYLMRNEMI